MKIIVTGHTSGLGLAIFNFFQQQEHHVIGFSKSTGFDISKQKDREKIVDAANNADMFVNNAYNNYDDSQFILLQEIFTMWKGLDKQIINISSRFTNDLNNSYSSSKHRQDEFCEQNIFKLPRILNIKPGLTDTPRVKSATGNKMSIDFFINVLDFSLQNKIQSVTFGF